MSAAPDLHPSMLERIRHDLVGLKMPRALEALDHLVRRLEHGEIGALEAIHILLSEELTLRENSRIKTHVLAAERLHADDTTVPILAKCRTDTGRIWTYVRDDRPFGGPDPPALYFASRDRRQNHPNDHLAGWRGILQADAYGGYNGLYDPARPGGAVTSALCWGHARRGFFELADIAAKARRGPAVAPISPTALEAVRRIV